MIVNLLVPTPLKKESFHPSREKYIPERSGCYALTTFDGNVLYVGLAKNLRRRMHDHLDDPMKTNATSVGRAILFYWIESADINKVERTWLNIHASQEGVYPILNKIYSPTSV